MLTLLFSGCKGNKNYSEITLTKFVDELGKRIDIRSIEINYNMLPDDYNPNNFKEVIVFDDMYGGFNQDYYQNYIYDLINGVAINKHSFENMHGEEIIYFEFYIFKISNDELLKEAKSGKLTLGTFYVMSDNKIHKIERYLDTIVNGNFLMIYETLDFDDSFLFQLFMAFYSIPT